MSEANHEKRYDEPSGTEFYDAASEREMMLIDDDGHPFDGWICYKHPDGQWVSLRKATDEDLRIIREPHNTAKKNVVMLHYNRSPAPESGWRKHGYPSRPTERLIDPWECCEKCGEALTGGVCFACDYPSLKQKATDCLNLTGGLKDREWGIVTTLECLEERLEEKNEVFDSVCEKIAALREELGCTEVDVRQNPARWLGSAITTIGLKEDSTNKALDELLKKARGSEMYDQNPTWGKLEDAIDLLIKQRDEATAATFKDLIDEQSNTLLHDMTPGELEEKTGTSKLSIVVRDLKGLERALDAIAVELGLDDNYIAVDDDGYEVVAGVKRQLATLRGTMRSRAADTLKATMREAGLDHPDGLVELADLASECIGDLYRKQDHLEHRLRRVRNQREAAIIEVEGLEERWKDVLGALGLHDETNPAEAVAYIRRLAGTDRNECFNSREDAKEGKARVVLRGCAFMGEVIQAVGSVVTEVSQMTEDAVDSYKS